MSRSEMTDVIVVYTTLCELIAPKSTAPVMPLHLSHHLFVANLQTLDSQAVRPCAKIRESRRRQ